MRKKQFEKKVALITGASRGIGKAISYRLAEDGYYVILASRTLTDLEKVLHDVRMLGGDGRAVVCDVSSQQDVNLVIDELPAIDVLINNAGQGGGGPLTEMDDAIWHSVMNTNVNSVYYMTKAVLARKKLNKPGAIINIASTGGKQGVVYAAAYSASKHAVVGFTKALGLELAKQDITVNAVCPGFVETEMAAKVRENYSKIWGTTVDEAKTRIEQRVPMGRYIQPEEVAGIVSYLASPQARGVTAQAMNVCGGLGNY